MSVRPRFLFASALACGWITSASAQIVIPAGATFDLNGGRMDLGCIPLQVGGTYDLGGGAMLHSGTFRVQTGGTFEARGQSEFGGDFINQGTIDAAGSTVTLDGSCTPAGGTIVISGAGVFTNLVVESSSGLTFQLAPGAQIQVTDSLEIHGQPGKPVNIVAGDPSQPAVIGTASGTRVTQTDAALGGVSVGGGTTPVQVAATPVPGLGAVGGLLLSLLLLTLSGGALRGRRIRSIFGNHP